MAELLSANLDLIAAKVQAASDIFVFSDFDGTLVPIKDSPSECFLEPSIKKILSLLAHHHRVTIGIVSGRELGDLKTRVGIDGIIYAGNHGLEIEGPGFSFREPIAVAMITELQNLSRVLSGELIGIPGALIEDKKLSISIHYRKVDPREVPQLIETTRRAVASSPIARQLVMKSGKMILEIRPDVKWHKGTAATWLTKKSTTGSVPVTIFIGDDETDEDAFASLSDQITICVGMSRKTMAKYVTVAHGDVLAFMTWLQGVVPIKN